MKRSEVKKYRAVKLKFTGYYKYYFTFSGEAPDGTIISINLGGCPDRIYNLDVAADSTITVGQVLAFVSFEREAPFAICGTEELFLND